MQMFKKVLVLAMCLGLFSAPAMARQAMGIHAKIVDGFLFAQDYSGSMMQKHKATDVQKIEMAKQAMSIINAKIPGLDYQGALSYVAPNKGVIAPAAWNRADWGKTINGLDNKASIYGRGTPLSKSLEALSPVLQQLPASKALVLFSDGCENRGGNLTSALQALYAANPGLVMHFVSVADNAKSAAVLKDLAALNPKSVFVDARDIINTEECALDFARKVFYNETIPADAVESLHEVFFQSGRYNILPKYAKRLDKLAAIMVTRPELKIFIEGFADPSGNTKSNQTLSENRANAVKKYLLGKGVKADNLIIKGRGETDRFPSYLQDRRVEIMIITQ